MLQYLAIATIIVSVFNAAQANSISRDTEDLVQIDFYYTSLCSDARWFVNNHFFSTYEVLGEHMNVAYIPYGRTQRERLTLGDGSQQWNFTCQFGAEDCHGNKAHACAINEILTNSAITNEQLLLAGLLGCTMNSTNPALAVPSCLYLIGLTITQVASVNLCAVSTQGDELLASHGETTDALEPPLDFVPTIVVNKVFSQTNQDNSFVDFQGIVCQNIPAGSRPVICSDSTWLHNQKSTFFIMILSLVFYTGKPLDYLYV